MMIALRFHRFDDALWTCVGSGHVRCFLTGRSGGRLKAIAFNSADSDLGHLLLTSQSRRLHLAGTIRSDIWQGRTEAQLIIDDAAPAF